MSGSSSIKARKTVAILSGIFGKIPWWPGDTEEVMIGAILTQQTRWENVEQALLLLKNNNLATMSAIHAADPVKIEESV